VTWYFLGNELASFDPSDTNVTEATAGNPPQYDSAFVRGYIACPSETAYAQTPQFSALTTCWTHVHIGVENYSGTSAGHKFMAWLNGSGTEVVRLTHTKGLGAAEAITIDYWNGSAWVTADTETMSMTTIQHLDIKIVCNSASGVLEVYNNGTLRLSAAPDLSTIASIRRMRVYGTSVAGIGFDTYFSQVGIRDVSTIGCRFMTRYPSGAGATSSWTGAYTDIDELVNSDADFILSSTNDQISTFAQTGPTITGYTVSAVGVYVRAKRGSSGPANIRPVLRVSGTDYDSGSNQSLTEGYTAVGTIWETNPATTAAWLNTAIDALQPGVRART
jgi:hypothetical protein